MSGRWLIRHIDLSVGPQSVAGGEAPHFLVFWWGPLPLGCKALRAEELPMATGDVADFAAQLVAGQAAARFADLGAPLTAGVDGQPRLRVTRQAAVAASGLLERLDALAAQPLPPAGLLSVVICTRDRPQMLRGCLESLAAQVSPPGQVVVVDNSGDRSAEPVCAGRAGVSYVHEPRPGLSLARNAGIAAATGPLVAFTDDDVELSETWTGEIVRAFDDPSVNAVTGMVLPSRLETPAQAAFELDLGGFTQRFYPIRFEPSFLAETRGMGPQTWRIGAGANMAFRREAFARLGGFDARLGAGASGCSEDSEYWRRILEAGGTCLYEPRAVVFHHHRADWAGLRQQYRAYMQGHVSALVAQADRYASPGDLRRIFRQLPAYFVRTGLKSVQTLDGWRLALLAHEAAGWVLGLQYLVRLGWRARGRPIATSAAPAVPEVANA